MISEIVLASKSPFRAQLLESIGLQFTTMPSKVDETNIQAKDSKTIALERAKAKALTVSKQKPEALVIGCDQTLEFKGQTFDKAKSEGEAKQRLREFSGQSHFLHSAVTLYRGAAKLKEAIVSSEMKMRVLDSSEIERYIQSGEWQGCVGCYQFENKGGLLFEPGFYDSSAVIGLPIPTLNKLLLELGLNAVANPQGPWSLVAD